MLRIRTLEFETALTERNLDRAVELYGGPFVYPNEVDAPYLHHLVRRFARMSRPP